MKLYGAIDLHSNNNVTVVMTSSFQPTKIHFKASSSSRPTTGIGLVDGHRLFSN